MDDYLKILDALFTHGQQIALAIITVSVMSLVQVFKNVYFGFYPVNSKVKKRAILWLAAFVFGAVGGVVGYFVGEPQPLWFWIFSGVASGGTAIGIFKLITAKVWTRIKSTIINKQ